MASNIIVPIPSDKGMAIITTSAARQPNGIKVTSTNPIAIQLTIRVHKPDGSGMLGSALTFRKIKIFFAKPNSIIPLARGLNNPIVDYSGYHAVCKYYNIEE